MNTMELCNTSIKGLFVKYCDYETTYTKNGGGELGLYGEYSGGEAWINGDHYSYERIEDLGEVVIRSDDGQECYRFEDSEEGWDSFANGVI